MVFSSQSTGELRIPGQVCWFAEIALVICLLLTWIIVNFEIGVTKNQQESGVQKIYQCCPIECAMVRPAHRWLKGPAGTGGTGSAWEGAK